MGGSIIGQLQSGWGVELPAADVWLMSHWNVAASPRISAAELWRHGLLRSPAGLVWLVDQYAIHHVRPPLIWAEFWLWLAPRTSRLFPEHAPPLIWKVDESDRARWNEPVSPSYSQAKDWWAAALVRNSGGGDSQISCGLETRPRAGRRRAVIKSLISRRLWESMTQGRDGAVEQILAELLSKFERHSAAVRATQITSIDLADPGLATPESSVLPGSVHPQSVPTELAADEELTRVTEKSGLRSEGESREVEVSDPAAQREFERRLHAAKMQSLKNFAYGASHEINNPLANIVMRAEALAKTENDPQRRKKLDAIRQQAWRAHHMISDLMLFANPPAPVWQQVSLGDFLVETANAWLKTCNPPPNLTWDIPASSAGKETQSWIDPTMFRELLAALWNNSRQAIGERPAGVIHTKLERLAGDAGFRLRVSDNGGGIPDDCLPFIFDPFFSGREAGRGLGFGLSKAWRIAELHGAELQCVSSQPGQTQFELVLPVGPPPTLSALATTVPVMVASESEAIFSRQETS